MQTLTLDTGQKLRYYLYLDEFPAERRSAFTRYCIESGELPKTVPEFAASIGSLLDLNAQGLKEDVDTALRNLLFAVNAVWLGYAPDELAFGVLIHDIDGVPNTDLSPDGLRETIGPLQIPVGTMARIVDEVKKNSSPNDSAIFLGLGAVFS